MADCATAGDARAAVAAGAEIVGTTLCGYTDETRGHALPAFDVLREAVATEAFAILEGGVADPAAVRAAFAAGASAVVVGTALTNLDARIRMFAEQSCATEVRDRKIFRHVQFEKVLRTSMENGVAIGIVAPSWTAASLRGCSWHIRSPRPK